MGLRAYVYQTKCMMPTSQADNSKVLLPSVSYFLFLINPPQEGSQEEVPSWFSGCYCYPLHLQIPTLVLDGGPLPSFVLCCSKEPCDLWGGLFHMPQFPYLYNGKKQPRPTPTPAPRAFRSDSEKSRTFAL